MSMYRQEESHRVSPPRGGEGSAYESKQYFADEDCAGCAGDYVDVETWPDFAVTHMLAN